MAAKDTSSWGLQPSTYDKSSAPPTTTSCLDPSRRMKGSPCIQKSSYPQSERRNRASFGAQHDTLPSVSIEKGPLLSGRPLGDPIPYWTQSLDSIAGLRTCASDVRTSAITRAPSVGRPRPSGSRTPRLHPPKRGASGFGGSAGGRFGGCGAAPGSSSSCCCAGADAGAVGGAAGGSTVTDGAGLSAGGAAGGA